MWYLSSVIQPFLEYPFMQRALWGCILLAVSSGPLGVFLLLRRMILVGDALSHGLLPGMAVGFLFWGSSLWALTFGGMAAGLVIMAATTVASRGGWLTEDGAFAGFYLISMAAGVLVLSCHGHQADLVPLLFGSPLSIAPETLLFTGAVSGLTLLVCFFFYRPLVMECFDPMFFRAVGGKTSLMRGAFLSILTMNVVASFHALGALMSLGLLVLPAITMRLATQRLWKMCVGASILGSFGSAVGLWLSYWWNCPSGPSIIGVLGVLYMGVLAAVHSRALFEKKAGKPGCCTRKVLMLWCACVFVPGKVSGHSGEGPLRVVVSSCILKDWVQQVAGEDAEVASLLKPGEDAHHYHPGPQHSALLGRAHLVIVHGLGFDTWALRLLAGCGGTAAVVDLGEKLAPCVPCLQDPHVWHDVALARRCLPHIAEGLSVCRPAGRENFWHRAREYERKLEDLDAWVRQSITALGKAQAFIIGHGAFQYYQRAYGLSITTLPLGGETSARQLASAIHHSKSARSDYPAAIFFGCGFRQDFAQTLAADMGLTLGGMLYMDDLSESGAGAGTYEELMRFNTRCLVEGLRKAGKKTQAAKKGTGPAAAA